MQAYRKIMALGTEVEIYLQQDISGFDPERDINELELLIHDFENSFSRFIEDSELSRLNRTEGNFKASPEMMRILLLAEDFYRATDGIFDPTILKALKDEGYDKSFGLLNKFEMEEALKSPFRISFNNISIDPENNLITKPNDLELDFGGIGKGYVVDLIAGKLKDKGYRNFWISAGGDMYLSGLNEDKRAYQVGIQNPLKLDQDIFKLEIIHNELAVATSGISKRQWVRNGKALNHIIDPRTGHSVENNLLAVTVISDQAAKADVYAKTVLILGKEAGLNFINNLNDTETLIVDKDLQMSLSANMNKYLIEI